MIEGPNSATALALRGVSAAYGPRTVLRDVDLEVGEGEWVGVVGPNGAGKSTLIRLITGSLDPTAGDEVAIGLHLKTASRS